MKNKLITIVSYFTVFAVIFSSVSFAARPVHAAGNTLFLNPKSSQVNVGSSFTVDVLAYVETALANGRASGTVTYPAGLLNVTSISRSGDFGDANITQGSGTIGFSASKSPGPQGQGKKIFSITFQGKSGGTAGIGFSSDSNVNNTSTRSIGASFSIIAPTPAPSPSPSPAPSPAPTSPSPSPTSPPAPATPTPTPTEPTPTTPSEAEEVEQPTVDSTGLIDNVTVISQYTSTIITWKVTKDNTTPNLAYGTSRSDVGTKVDAIKKEDGTFEATIPNLSPGLRYYFTISGRSPDGVNGSYNGLISTRGYPTEILVNEGAVAASGARVKIGQQSYTASNEGVLKLGLAEGNYSGTVTTNYSSKSITFTVAKKEIPSDGSAPELQKYTFALTSAPTEEQNGSLSIFTFIGVLVVGAVVVGGGFFAYLIWRRKRFENNTGTNFGSAVIIDDGYNWRERNQAPESPAGPPPTSPYPMPPPNPVIQKPVHNNSVYMDEEEPLDMFEIAEKQNKTPQ